MVNRPHPYFEAGHADDHMAFQASRLSVRIGTAPWFSQSSVQERARIIAANITSQFILKKLLALAMIPKLYGHFTTIGSFVGPRHAVHRRPLYAESKAPPVGLTSSVAQDLASHGTPVNGIAPEQVLCDFDWTTEGAVNRLAISWICGWPFWSG